MVEELVTRIIASVSAITNDYEIILINDASPDNSWEEIKHQCSLNPKVKGLNLSRNFGQHYAITAGLSYAKGEWVVVMDCDLQDRPGRILYTLESYPTINKYLLDKGYTQIRHEHYAIYYPSNMIVKERILK